MTFILWSSVRSSNIISKLTLFYGQLALALVIIFWGSSELVLFDSTVCLRSLGPFYIVSCYIKWVKTFWTYTITPLKDYNRKFKFLKISWWGDRCCRRERLNRCVRHTQHLQTIYTGTLMLLQGGGGSIRQPILNGYIFAYLF